MKHIALMAAALVALATPAAAQDWRLVGRGDGMLAMDIDSINRDTEGRAFVRTLIVYEWPDSDGTDYLISYVEFDCWTADRWRNVTVSAFKNRRVENGVFDNYEWEPVYPGTLAEDAFKVACQRGPTRARSSEDDPHVIADRYIREHR